MAESPSWAERLAEARARVVFEATPSGATPYASTLEQLAEALDAVEVARAASTPSSVAETLGRAVAVLLREAINARLYERNLHTRFEQQPDRVDRLCDILDTLISRGKIGV